MYCHLSFPISKSSSELMKGSQASPLHRDLSKSELLGKVSSFKDLPMKPKDLGISIEVDDMAVKRKQRSKVGRINLRTAARHSDNDATTRVA